MHKKQGVRKSEVKCLKSQRQQMEEWGVNSAGLVLSPKLLPRVWLWALAVLGAWQKTMMDSGGRQAFNWSPSPAAAATAAKSLQLCPTLCNPIDGGPPGSPIPGILQTRTLEWVAISFSNAWKWKVKEKLLSRVRLFATPWTAAYQAPPSMGFSKEESQLLKTLKTIPYWEPQRKYSHKWFLGAIKRAEWIYSWFQWRS